MPFRLRRLLLTHSLFAAFLPAFLIACSPVALAQWSASDRDAIADQVEAAAKKINENRFPSPHGAKRRFLRDLQSADDFLAANTSKKNHRRWMKYLDVADLKETLDDRSSLKSSRTARAIGRHAVALRYRLIGTTPGLELPVLTRLRASTEGLIDAIRFRNSDRSMDQLSQKMERFAEDVREMDSSPTAEDVASITQMMGLMESSGQAPKLVAHLKSRFRNPNIKVIVSEHVVQSAINRGVHRSQPVRDCILGTRIEGTATLGGMVTADVLPSVGSARVQVTLAGQVSSRNTGYNGPVKLHTAAQGQVNVTRMLHIHEGGVQAEPAVATASLTSQILSIDHKRRFVRRIARRKANEQKPNAERIATERLRQQVSADFTKQTDEATAISIPDPMDKVRPILTRLDLSEPTRQIGSTDNAVYLEATLASEGQLAAPGLSRFASTRPTLSGRYDVALQLHETVIDNVISPVLAGRTMTETQINKLLQRTPIAQSSSSKDSGSNTDDDDDKEKDEPPFEIDFARLRPIVFEARDQTIKLGIRGTRFAQGRRELKQSLEITATYTPARMPDGTAMLIRSGKIKVDFPSRKRKLSVSQTGLKKTIEKKFANVFPEMLLHRDLQVPPTVKLEAIAGRSFRPETIDARDGWITLTVIR